MGLFNFLKDAGEKIFGTADSSKDISSKVTSHVQQYNIPGSRNIQVECNADGVATVTGECDTAQVKDLILVATGNIAGVKEVDDKILVTNGATTSTAPDNTYYEVKAGDTLSKIAKQFYQDANKYNVIFEANKPMLSHPDKIYPGQTLIIPKL